MNICIIGSNGYIGQYLCRLLQSRGHNLQSVSSKDEHGIDIKTGLLNDSFNLNAETECVVYLAQSPYVGFNKLRSNHLYNVNVISAIKVAKKLEDQGGGKFIYTSTGNVFSPSYDRVSEKSACRRNDWYALSKLHAEEALNLFSATLEIINLRLFGIYGPMQTNRLIPNLIKKIRDGVPVFLEKNSRDDSDVDGLKLSLTYINDLTHIMESMICNGAPPLVNVASNQALSLRDIATEIGFVLGHEPNFCFSDQYRQGNLVADTKLLTDIITHQFVPFSEGIQLTVESAKQVLDS